MRIQPFIGAVIVVGTCAITCGCGDSTAPPPRTVAGSASVTVTPVTIAVEPQTSPKTPLDQSNKPDDLRITAEIRKAIMEDEAMSVNAQNCKIITQDGVVTLRGQVDSEFEKEAVALKAKKVPGVVRVENQLDVKAA